MCFSVLIIRIHWNVNARWGAMSFLAYCPVTEPRNIPHFHEVHPEHPEVYPGKKSYWLPSLNLSEADEPEKRLSKLSDNLDVIWNWWQMFTQWKKDVPNILYCQFSVDLTQHYASYFLPTCRSFLIKSRISSFLVKFLSLCMCFYLFLRSCEIWPAVLRCIIERLIFF